MPQPIVLDTNIVLDVFVFNDAAAQPLKTALEAGELNWLATQAMRDELERVLAYPQIIPRLAFYELSAAGVLAAFDRHARLNEVPAKAGVTCSDADDQKFIDLAVAAKAILLSKDRAVTSMAKRLMLLGVAVLPAWGQPPENAGQASAELEFRGQDIREKGHLAAQLRH